MPKVIRKDSPSALPAGRKKGIHYGKKRIRMTDPYALILSSVIAAVVLTLAVVCNQTGFDKKWYGDVISTFLCIVGFFALLNIGYVLIEGIVIEHGVVFLGTDAEKKPIMFKVDELESISLCDEDGEALPEGEKRWHNATLCFTLKSGAVRHYAVHVLSKRKYSAILAYFENRSH